MGVRVNRLPWITFSFAFVLLSASRGTDGSCFNIDYPIRQDAPSGCSSYTNCWNATQCVIGVVYESCGIADCNFPRRCTKYTNGTYNPATGKCEGGTEVSVYQDGVICYQSSPIVGCDSEQ